MRGVNSVFMVDSLTSESHAVHHTAHIFREDTTFVGFHSATQFTRPLRVIRM